ncbi:GNAT family N-acetyltransferase [Paraburkholderia acidisoli]|uniref:GNAT family N-acetyltransferase n=2 Tax=Paraburkholderia acidisoli TaxID=2571748 RepID=A0A7Z2GJF4_9BURK|nr:GNAT family N-acetyltransferase [Paraburkholderia acidisoli]
MSPDGEPDRASRGAGGTACAALASLAVRRYVPEQDAAELAALFRASIGTLAATHYDAAQREAWVSSADDLAAFGARLARGVTLVARNGGTAVAFAQLAPVDHVEMLYVAPAWARRGVGGALIAQLERIARASRASVLSVDASAISRPVFERAGFSLIASEAVLRDGVSLPRFHLCKPLTAANLSG